MQKYRIPLLINDRVDVAVAVGAEDVHLGQDSMHISDARKVLGDEVIIDVTCCNMEEAENAFQHGADYLSIDTMFPMSTNKVDRTSSPCVRLDSLESYTEKSRHEIDNRYCRHPKYSRIHCCSRSGHPCRSHWKYQYLKRATSPPSNLLIDAPPYKTLRHRRGKRYSRLATPSICHSLRKRIDSAYTAFYSRSPRTTPLPTDVSTLISQVPSITRKHALANPLCHNMTNLVVQNFAANVCLATGSSPCAKKISFLQP
jgi:thiamine-phosphate diphosphorylase / hydroxyethylthiazole kinase